MRYPEGLVHRYGAKAGILLYVRDKLPNIPQADMVVSEPGEPVDSLLKRADEHPILWPRLFRSSAVAELTGYEGEFFTEEVDGYEVGHAEVAWNDRNYSMFRNPEYFQRGVKEVVERVRSSTQRVKNTGKGQELPDQINVIIAEKSPSSLVGTYLKHPNRDNFYLVSVTDPREGIHKKDPVRATFTLTSGHEPVYHEYFSSLRSEDSFKYQDLKKEISLVASWHDQIARLAQMDPTWVYQIEFGITPPCLYQVRPFSAIRRADFKLPKTNDGPPPIIIGITPKQGIIVRTQRGLIGLYDENQLDYSDPSPSLYVGSLRNSHESKHLLDRKVNLLCNSQGLLAHRDIQIARQADVTAYYPAWPSAFNFKHGDWVNVRSDGTNIIYT